MLNGFHSLSSIALRAGEMAQCFRSLAALQEEIASSTYPTAHNCLELVSGDLMYQAQTYTKAKHPYIENKSKINIFKRLYSYE